MRPAAERYRHPSAHLSDRTAGVPEDEWLIAAPEQRLVAALGRRR